MILFVIEECHYVHVGRLSEGSFTPDAFRCVAAT